ncbi:MAG: type transport system ATP-binding protein [Actinomycetota bacterium]|nr:type transport system ATP-binding protein [Actinomycetota bacterium]
MNLLVARGLETRIRRRAIVRGVGLRWGAGVRGLLGKNGAGKTTLIRTLATALSPSAGTLEILGTDVASRRDLPGLRRRIGYAPQHTPILRHLTVRDQVAYAGWLKGVSADSLSERVEVVLEQVDLADRAGSRTRSLSGGMQRRLAVAMALVADPPVLFLDEPTAGLDPTQRIMFRRLVGRLGSERLVVLSTHLIEDVVAACQEVTVLHAGQVVFEGSPQDLAGAGRTATGRTQAPDTERSPVEVGFATVIGENLNHE